MCPEQQQNMTKMTQTHPTQNKPKFPLQSYVNICPFSTTFSLICTLCNYLKRTFAAKTKLVLPTRSKLTTCPCFYWGKPPKSSKKVP